MQGSATHGLTWMRLTKWLMPRRSWSLDGMRRGMDDAVHILGFGIYFALGRKFAQGGTMGITIRQGSESDAAWVVRLLRSGTRDGHFGPTVSSQANGLMEALLHDGFLTMVKLRGSVQAPCRINTEFWVADIDEAPSSFLIALV